MSDHCTMINPACPTDLCRLIYGHRRSAEGYHLLETSTSLQKLDTFPQLPRGTSRQALVAAGSKMQNNPGAWIARHR